MQPVTQTYYQQKSDSIPATTKPTIMLLSTNTMVTIFTIVLGIDYQQRPSGSMQLALEFLSRIYILELEFGPQMEEDTSQDMG